MNEISMKGTVYGFSIDHILIGKENILNTR